MKSAKTFTRFAKWTSSAAGKPVVFGVALGTVLVWGVAGPLFGFSDTWQLVINTSTSIVTFLMVFLIQNTQNRDSHAIQVKLDELLRVIPDAHVALLDLEELEEKDLEKIRRKYGELAAKARQRLRAGEECISVPELDETECTPEMDAKTVNPSRE